MASAFFDWVVFPLLLPFILLWVLAGRVLSLLTPILIVPCILLVTRLYWAVPILRYPWKAHHNRGAAWLARTAFETHYCVCAIRRLLTLPLRRQTPRLYCLGIPACGTSALALDLQRHPAFSGIDGLGAWHPALGVESHFFTGILGRGAASSPALYRSFFPTVLTRWWRERVRRCGRWALVDCAACLPHVAKRIAALNPNAKLIFMLRDPIEAAFHTEISLRNLGVPLDWSLMEDVIAADPRFADTADDARFWADLEALAVTDPLPEDLPRRLYSRCSTVLRCVQYAERARPFLELFSPENILFVEHSEYVAHPEAALAEVCRFADVDPSLLKAAPARAAPLGEGRGRRMHPAVRRKLQHYFAGPNQRLFALVGRSYPWGEAADLEGADEEEGGAVSAAALQAALLQQAMAGGRPKTMVDRLKAAELLPSPKPTRKESGLVKRVVSVSASV